ncbi:MULTISPECIES: hypothetical protein [unclassified Streptomyces]|uniref:Integrase n=1 Tax=Streptomyces sp. NBC_00119 TaxID=2975659 RepID=A0AAU1UKM4_9ACTN|nr:MULTISPECIES: hypothetical protein [unclassified Streptomyces]MCX4649860.1 hypothetical protein [Streptomyces sp. NBC_01446]MCX5320927.1 hypothetical protein [Streptomyces sp. NBC_00120]
MAQHLHVLSAYGQECRVACTRKYTVAIYLYAIDIYRSAGAAIRVQRLREVTASCRDSVPDWPVRGYLLFQGRGSPIRAAI